LPGTGGLRLLTRLTNHAGGLPQRSLRDSLKCPRRLLLLRLLPGALLFLLLRLLLRTLLFLLLSLLPGALLFLLLRLLLRTLLFLLLSLLPARCCSCCCACFCTRC
jgi:hypothetical protein